MGGCYSGSYGYSERSYEPQWKTDMKTGVKRFFGNGVSGGNIADLVSAYISFFDSNKSGFIKVLAEEQGITDVSNIPKEFPEMEYEVKFNISPKTPAGAQNGLKAEPTIEQYLHAFSFPVSKGQNVRFFNDPVDAIAPGVNHFFGKGDEERLVVIEKGGGLYVKEKSQPMVLSGAAAEVPYHEIIVKRTEERHAATMDEILGKISAVMRDGGEYKGGIRKEKGDQFVLDTVDGRIYSFTVTRAALMEGVAQSGQVRQHQLEIEYAGYIPGFKGFVKDDEAQIVSGMIDLAKHVAFLSDNAHVAGGWRMGLSITDERKYDFVSCRGKGGESGSLVLPGNRSYLPGFLTAVPLLVEACARNKERSDKRAKGR
jgi:hypothetical protein